MNHNVPKGKWKQFKGESKKQWGKLTKDELDTWEGEGTKLVGKVQEDYGHLRNRVDREIDDHRKHPGD
ncbi:CsbD family protein [Cohnella candidum]|uniref:CsbD family protein n=1 Tax=Cohnella candidum TaxID=2674991 RepID=A0A3G3K293_9BACL|nr:CsbD family protein [Cohnella candidum]AYQ74291.1 CsbD family protein [Cohnella candidum]